MIFTIEEINKNVSLLPNMTLGFDIYDSCFSIQIALESSLWFVKKRIDSDVGPEGFCTPRVVVGDYPSNILTFLSPLLAQFKLPQVETAPYFNFHPVNSVY